MAIITLTTDFGTRDGYVGAMKGVIASRCSATIVDIAHDIPRGDVDHAAWVVRTACPYFPRETIHVVVVDPEVGGARAELVVCSGPMLFVGPDNGVFQHLDEISAWRIVRRQEDGPISPTFHGRDIFARAAARLATHGDPELMGPRFEPKGVSNRSRLPGEGVVVHVDHFGNLITDLPAAEAGQWIRIGERVLLIRVTYADVPSGELVAYIGSAGTIEIAVRDGRADELLNAARRMPISVAEKVETGPYR